MATLMEQKLGINHKMTQAATALLDQAEMQSYQAERKACTALTQAVFSRSTTSELETAWQAYGAAAAEVLASTADSLMSVRDSLQKETPQRWIKSFPEFLVLVLNGSTATAQDQKVTPAAAQPTEIAQLTQALMQALNSAPRSVSSSTTKKVLQVGTELDSLKVEGDPKHLLTIHNFLKQARNIVTRVDAALTVEQVLVPVVSRVVHKGTPNPEDYSSLVASVLAKVQGAFPDIPDMPALAPESQAGASDALWWRLLESLRVELELDRPLGGELALHAAKVIDRSARIRAYTSWKKYLAAFRPLFRSKDAFEHWARDYGPMLVKGLVARGPEESSSYSATTRRSLSDSKSFAEMCKTLEDTEKKANSSLFAADMSLAPVVARLIGVSDGDLERKVKDLRKQLADKQAELKRAQTELLSSTSGPQQVPVANSARPQAPSFLRRGTPPDGARGCRKCGGRHWHLQCLSDAEKITLIEETASYDEQSKAKFIGWVRNASANKPSTTAEE